MAEDLCGSFRTVMLEVYQVNSCRVVVSINGGKECPALEKVAALRDEVAKRLERLGNITPMPDPMPYRMAIHGEKTPGNFERLSRLKEETIEKLTRLQNLT